MASRGAVERRMRGEIKAVGTQISELSGQIADSAEASKALLQLEVGRTTAKEAALLKSMCNSNENDP